MERRDRPAVQIIVDGSEQVIQAAARQLAAYPLLSRTAAGRRNGGGVEVVNFYNPERRAAVNTVPGLVGMILTMTMVLFTSIALVRERERGNLEMLIATPVSPWELTVGKILPFVGIGLVQTTVVLVLGDVLFDVPLRGSLLDLYLAALVFITANLSLGIFISTLTRTQFQAMQMSFFTFLPQILLSGFMFPFAGMPVAARYVAEVMPLTHFLRLVRGIMLRGADLTELWPSLAALGAFIAVMLARRRVARAQAARLAGRLVRVELELDAVAGGVVEEELRDVQQRHLRRAIRNAEATSSAARTRRDPCS